MSTKFTAAAYLFSLAAAITAGSEGPIDRSARLASIFGDYEGCAIVKELGGPILLRHNEARAALPFSPCSTFKIFNALAGLDCGAITGPDMLLKWDGSPQSIKAWQRDHTLASAIRDSVLWYFKEVAVRIGPKRMQQYLDENAYGNRDMGAGGVFWVQGPLKISADQQVEFLERLYRGKLKFSPRTVETVRRLLVVREQKGAVLSGKIGSGRGEKGLGWFVGHLKTGEKEYLFAVNITGEGAWGIEARRIAEALLQELGLLPQQ